MNTPDLKDPMPVLLAMAGELNSMLNLVSPDKRTAIFDAVEYCYCHDCGEQTMGMVCHCKNDE